jgi:hypothetical protein
MMSFNSEDRFFEILGGTRLPQSGRGEDMLAEKLRKAFREQRIDHLQQPLSEEELSQRDRLFEELQRAGLFKRAPQPNRSNIFSIPIARSKSNGTFKRYRLPLISSLAAAMLIGVISYLPFQPSKISEPGVTTVKHPDSVTVPNNLSEPNAQRPEPAIEIPQQAEEKTLLTLKSLHNDHDSALARRPQDFISANKIATDIPSLYLFSPTPGESAAQLGRSLQNAGARVELSAEDDVYTLQVDLAGLVGAQNKQAVMNIFRSVGLDAPAGEKVSVRISAREQK